MAATNILGLHSHNFSNGVERLIAVWEKTPMVYNGTGWIRGGTLTDDKDAYMASFINHVFLVNGTDANTEYDGVDWRSQNNADHSPIASFISSYTSGARLFLFGIKINGLSYPSRAWFSDLPHNGTVTWGLQYGNDLTTTAGSAVVTSATAKFLTRNIKIADPLFITASTAIGNLRNKPYIVQSVDSETQLTLTENIASASTTDSYWVGSNWFDVGTDEGDTANGIGQASNEMIFFKKNSVHRYNVEGTTLRQIKDVPGTTSPKSIVSWGGYAYWYHPSGIYRTSGGTGENISNALEDVIDGVSTSNQTAVVGFVDQIRNEVNFYLGNVTTREGDTITNCVITLDLNSNIWCPRSYDRPIVAATNWLRTSIPEIYVGDNASGVFQLNTGTAFKTSSIPFALTMHPIFPAGEDAIVTFNRLRTYVDNGPDIQIFYKLFYKPMPGTESQWSNDDTWYPLQGSQTAERVDWYFPTDARASGVQFKVVQSGSTESFLIEKMTLYYSVPSNY